MVLQSTHNYVINKKVVQALSAEVDLVLDELTALGAQIGEGASWKAKIAEFLRLAREETAYRANRRRFGRPVGVGQVSNGPAR